MAGAVSAHRSALTGGIASVFFPAFSIRWPTTHEDPLFTSASLAVDGTGRFGVMEE